MKSYWFLFWACSVIWGFLAGFVFWLLSRQSRAEAKLRRIEHGLDEEQPPGV